ncbi:MAG: hypothetical protein ABWY36_01720 [Leifsonia sp.]
MNPWLRALQVATALGVVGVIGGGYALSVLLPQRRTEVDYAGTDWGMINTLEVLVIPAAAILALAGALALLAYGAARWRQAAASTFTSSEQLSTHVDSD